MCLIFPIIVIGLILFNGWYLQVLYDVGLTTIFEQFGIMLPQINYWVFVFINITFGGLYTLFKQNVYKKLDEKEKNLDAVDEEAKRLKDIFGEDIVIIK